MICKQYRLSIYIYGYYLLQLRSKIDQPLQNIYMYIGLQHCKKIRINDNHTKSTTETGHAKYKS